MTSSAMLIAAAAACAPPCAAPVGAEADLRAALVTYDSAWLAKDGPVVERTLAPEYTYFTSTGALSDKSATLAFLADTGYSLTLSRRTDVRVKLAGPTAVISSRWEGTGRYHAEPVRDDQTCGQTWVWRGSRWVLLSEHCVNRRAPSPEPA
jgi:hypothetical protein